jgi:hypothetical protein
MFMLPGDSSVFNIIGFFGPFEMLLVFEDDAGSPHKGA